MYDAAENDDFDREEVATYEEVMSSTSGRYKCCDRMNINQVAFTVFFLYDYPTLL